MLAALDVQNQINTSEMGDFDSPAFEEVVDGYSYNFTFRRGCLRYIALSIVNQLRVVRAAIGDRRPGYYIVPQQVSVTIPARGTFEYNLAVTPGAVIWGLSVVTAKSNNTRIAAPKTSIRITEMQTQAQIQLEHTLTSYYHAPLILPSLIVVTAPGEIFVEIGSEDASAQAIQVILLTSEPAVTCDMLVPPSAR